MGFRSSRFTETTAPLIGYLLPTLGKEVEMSLFVFLWLGLCCSFNQLDLPPYETYDKLRLMLLTACRECPEGFGFA